MKRGMTFSWLKLLNPKNLEKEVDRYGYHFSWKTHIVAMIGTLAGGSAVGLLFQLDTFFFTIILVVVGILLPILILDMYRKMYEQKRFADAATYMEQMLYSFQKTGKVLLALKETGEIFDEGQMKQLIRAAILELEKGKLEQALKQIETGYECPKLSAVHKLLLNAEEHGGEMENSVLILLEDLELWKRRGYRLQAEKKKSHGDNIISMIVAVMLCAVALYVLNSMNDMFVVETTLNILKISVIQVSSLLFLLFLLFIFFKSSRNLTANWLQIKTNHEDGYIQKCYESVKHYEAKKAKKKRSLGLAPIGYRLAKRDVTEEIYLTLPGWLMELALLLQNNNVQVAIAKSKAGAPVVIQEEIDLLMERMEREPQRLTTYTRFCSEFDVPEVLSCMKMLHAVSEMGSGDAKTQINNLIARVNEMQDIAEQIQNEKASFYMKMMFSYPVIAATVKLLTDLTVGMAVMFQMLGSMGGA